MAGGRLVYGGRPASPVASVCIVMHRYKIIVVNVVFVYILLACYKYGLHDMYTRYWVHGDGTQVCFCTLDEDPSSGLW